MIRRSDLCGHTYRATPCSHPAPQSHRPHCLVLVSPSSVVFSTTRYACLLTGSVTHSPQTHPARGGTRAAQRLARPVRAESGAALLRGQVFPSPFCGLRGHRRHTNRPLLADA